MTRSHAVASATRHWLMLRFIPKRRFWLPQLGWRRPPVCETPWPPEHVFQFQACLPSHACRTAAGCTARRGGFQFPFIGCWTKRGVLCITDGRAEAARQRYSGWPTTLSRRRALRAWSPSTNINQLFAAWRAWQLGLQVWRDLVAIPPMEMARLEPRTTCLVELAGRDAMVTESKLEAIV